MGSSLTSNGVNSLKLTKRGGLVPPLSLALACYFIPKNALPINVAICARLTFCEGL
jgi:hypothetical protein